MAEEERVEQVPEDSESLREYAVSLADDAYSWYQQAAIRARRRYRASECMVLVLSASIAASGSIWTDLAVPGAIMGAATVVVVGVQRVFHWHENYLRFSQAREAVERERRLYTIGEGRYTDLGLRHTELVKAVSEIEAGEMLDWSKVAGAHSKSQN